MRPLCAALSFSSIPSSGLILDGVQRMRERPIADLIDGLVQLGIDAELTGKGDEGCPPVRIGEGRRTEAGGAGRRAGVNRHRSAVTNSPPPNT